MLPYYAFLQGVLLREDEADSVLAGLIHAQPWPFPQGAVTLLWFLHLLPVRLLKTASGV